MHWLAAAGILASAIVVGMAEFADSSLHFFCLHQAIESASVLHNADIQLVLIAAGTGGLGKALPITFYNALEAVNVIVSSYTRQDYYIHPSK